VTGTMGSGTRSGGSVAEGAVGATGGTVTAPANVLDPRRLRRELGGLDVTTGSPSTVVAFT
jgi:hypothetical protein